VGADCTHVYYVYGLQLELNALGVKRRLIVEALRAEGVPGIVEGYQNVHLLPMFRNKIAYGSKGFPWTSPYNESSVSYEPGLCPIAENLHNNTFFGLNLCAHNYSQEDVDLIVKAFKKVWQNLEVLR